VASDPYSYPGTDTLRNRLGITDGTALTEAERRLTLARGAVAARLTFPATAEGLPRPQIAIDQFQVHEVLSPCRS